MSVSGANDILTPQSPAGGNPPDNGIPGCHLRNHTGGVGLPTGYDYLYPREHVKIHVFKTKDKPWQINPPSADLTTHVKLFVPCTVTTMELMKQLGKSSFPLPLILPLLLCHPHVSLYPK